MQPWHAVQWLQTQHHRVQVTSPITTKWESYPSGQMEVRKLVSKSDLSNRINQIRSSSRINRLQPSRTLECNNKFSTLISPYRKRSTSHTSSYSAYMRSTENGERCNLGCLPLVVGSINIIVKWQMITIPHVMYHQHRYIRSSFNSSCRNFQLDNHKLQPYQIAQSLSFATKSRQHRDLESCIQHTQAGNL